MGIRKVVFHVEMQAIMPALATYHDTGPLAK